MRVRFGPAVAGRRVALALAAAVATLVTAGADQRARAEDFPSRPIRLVVPAAAGGPTYLTARLLADKMERPLGQPVVVEAKGGGGGNVGAETVAKSAPDGYTILMATIGTHAINRTLYRKLTYDSQKDFVPVSQVVQYPLLLVANPKLPAQSVAELITYARAHPGKVLRASGGIGTSMHLSGELFVHQAGLDMPHVPYKGSAPALTDMVGNHVQVMFDALMTALPLVQAGQLKALAVTGTQRSPVIPDVPTVAEAGLPGYSATGWIGIVAPAGTPDAIVRRLNAAVVEALADPELRQKLIEQAAEPIGSSPDEFARFIALETDKWAQAVRSAGITVD
ncbi:Bug family tripartite tricarboxylate transporter substrate binding protein [Rhodoplanes roseus]|uniref:LacI family transcriptional regulator n=1 Tax=Rhodoplanes roseus TaxID=29409 RepID=A0A327KHS4_9BRAD|nr:tripartite tricarboxylate transporter substrate binding protein [Rhodoplanes roseus]RAI38309.1 LacI family transcriptional regulator [Rhodoplanes roseus]